MSPEIQQSFLMENIDIIKGMIAQLIGQWE